ncbi:MAG TPA: TauD/TfdA family dioxygenase [Polyangiaceae bacterium]|nr:TauD/TfdA family dioxygenase [Polyangiaceae bacterium]
MQNLTLRDEERERLKRQLLALPGSPYDDPEAYLLALYPIIASLPARLLAPIFEFSRFNRSPGVLLLGNLPCDDTLPISPAAGRVSDKGTFVSEATLLGIGQLIGEVTGYLREKQGELIQNVVPERSGAHTQSNKSAGVFLQFHNDLTIDATRRFFVTNPDFSLLLCLRADRHAQAFTYYVESAALEQRLSADDTRLLCSPHYRFSSPHGYSAEGGERIWSSPQPILIGPEGAREIRLAANGVEATSADAAAALRRLYELCADPSVHSSHHLRPGEMLLLNNRKGVHARSVFEARFDAEERWLQRAYLRKGLWPLRECATERARVFQ